MPRIGARLRNGITVRDLALLLAAPTILSLVAALPAGVRRSLVLDATAPTTATAYAAHFVHTTAGQLLVNVSAYLLVAGVAYLLAVLNGETRRFRTRLLGVVLGLPFVLSAMTLAFVGARFSYGFSGVVMGVLALLALELFTYLGRTLTTLETPDDAAVVFFLEITLIAAVVYPQTPGALAVVVVAGLVTLGYGVSLFRTARCRERVCRPVAWEPGYLELACVGTILLAVFPFLAFPAGVATAGGIVNVVIHLFGFSLTFLAAFLLPKITAVLPVKHGGGIDTSR
jgi:hypothetical protein